MAIAGKQPNILFIMADQLPPFLTEAYGHPVVRTPYVAQLAQEGIRFDNAYTPYPLCAPARAALATGKYASRLGVYDNASAFPVDELTFSHYLTLAGYDCLASGKLHYVGPDQLHGFSRRLTGDIYPEDYRWLTSRDPNEPPGGHAAQYLASAIRVGEAHSNLAYDDEVAFRAIQYLQAKGGEKRHNPNTYQPFFLQVSFHHPHDPFKPPQAFWDLYEDAPIDLPADRAQPYSVLDRWLNAWHACDIHDVTNPDSLRVVRRAFYALVSYIDEKVGQLLTALRQNDLDRDTVVVFTSDHGDMLGEKGMVQKRTFYEWSARVPLIFRFASGLGSGTTVSQPVSLLDLLPTFLEIGHVEDYLPVEGHSLMPLMRGEDTEAWDVFAESHAEGVYGTCFMLRHKSYKYNYIAYEGGEDTQLFDLHTDLGEWVNLVGDPDYQAIELDMRRRILARFDPMAIEADIRESLQRRQLLKRWMERVDVSWAYTPHFDGRKRTLNQYLPQSVERDR